MKVDTDYSGRPIEPLNPSDPSQLAWLEHVDDIILHVFEDGTEAMDLDGTYYPLSEDGAPDFDQPIETSKK